VSFLLLKYLISEEGTGNICRDCGAEKVTGSRDLAPKTQAGQTEAGTVSNVILVNGEPAEGTHS